MSKVPVVHEEGPWQLACIDSAFHEANAFGRIPLKQRDKECKKGAKWTLGYPHLKERIKALALASDSTCKLQGEHAAKKADLLVRLTEVESKVDKAIGMLDELLSHDVQQPAP